MNKKIIYAISTIAMLIVAISIGFIFSTTVPPMVNLTAQNTDDSNSVTQTLEPIENLITQSAQGKPIPAGNTKTAEKSVAPATLDNLTFSANDTKKDATKEKAEATKMKETAKVKENSKLETKKSELVATPAVQEKIAPKKADSTKIEATTVTEEEQNKKTPAEETKAATEKKVAQKKSVLITKSSLQSKDGLSSIINAELSMDGDQVKLIIEGDNTVETKSFILEEPNRVVFDIKGTWAITIPRIISNRMVKDIRLGKTDTHTRLVFDLKVKPNSTKITQLGPNKAQITFK